jgi:hypothetical protein
MTILCKGGIPRFQEKYEILAATKLSSRPERTRISGLAPHHFLLSFAEEQAGG